MERYATHGYLRYFRVNAHSLTVGRNSFRHHIIVGVHIVYVRYESCLCDFGLIGLFIYVRNEIVCFDSQLGKISLFCVWFTHDIH